MPREVTDIFREESHKMSTGYVILDSVKIDHESLNEPMYFVNNTENIEYEGKTYLATAFTFSLPDEEGSTNNEAQLSICNIDRSLIPLIRSITDYPTLEYRALLVGNEVTTEAGPYLFQLRQVSYDAQAITGTLMYDFRPDKKLSTVRVTVRNFPGLQNI